jgi:hypothetical protein
MENCEEAKAIYNARVGVIDVNVQWINQMFNDVIALMDSLEEVKEWYSDMLKHARCDVYSIILPLYENQKSNVMISEDGCWKLIEIYQNLITSLNITWSNTYEGQYDWNDYWKRYNILFTGLSFWCKCWNAIIQYNNRPLTDTSETDDMDYEVRIKSEFKNMTMRYLDNNFPKFYTEKNKKNFRK